MFRRVLITVIVVCISEPTFAIVESAGFHSTLTSERATTPATRCSTDIRHTGFGSQALVTELDDCGISIASEYSVQDSGDFRLYDRALSQYGFTSILFSRRYAAPLGGIDRQREGAGIVTGITLIPHEGASAVSTSISLVERLRPTTRDDFGPAILTLDVTGERLDKFSTASVRVFDHDTDELLLSWVHNGEPLEPNNGFWFSQELDFDDRRDHAIRFELEADGRSVRQSQARFAAAAFLNVPEPGSMKLALPILLVFGALREQRRPLAISVRQA